MDINSTMAVVNDTIGAGWFQYIKTTLLWVIEWLFFVALTQTAIMSTTYIYLTAHGSTDKLNSGVFANIVTFSMLFAAFVEIYLV